jgi:hypothetical protein
VKSPDEGGRADRTETHNIERHRRANFKDVRMRQFNSPVELRLFGPIGTISCQPDFPYRHHHNCVQNGHRCFKPTDASAPRGCAATMAALFIRGKAQMSNILFKQNQKLLF